jgi:hypothetical protein
MGTSRALARFFAEMETRLSNEETGDNPRHTRSHRNWADIPKWHWRERILLQMAPMRTGTDVIYVT